MYPFTLQQVFNTMEDLGHVVFRGNTRRGFKPYDPNFIGIRNLAPGERDSNRFNDWILAAWQGSDADWDHIVSNSTTDPGLKPRLDPGHADGVAMLLPGQYRRCWKRGLHKGRYPALRQCGPMDFRRDYDGDGNLDPAGPVITDVIGANMHHASAKGESMLVDGWSEACQVHSDILFFDAFMAIADRSVENWGEYISYTLLESTDVAARDASTS